jgi:hypothetical protein
MTQPDDFLLSTIEELDPEPGVGEGFSRKREFALGVVLVLAVLAWAFWQVWTTEVKRESYRRGGEAAGLKEWEEARTHYVAASGYKDADSRAAEAVRNITERDRQYKAALDLAGRGEWVKAVRSTMEVRRIQPGFLQPMPEPLADAEGQVYRDALEGVIALRTEARPPGLYYRSAKGWVYLDGSDRHSSVLGAGVSSRVIYDVPGDKQTRPGDATPGPSMRSGQPGSPGLAGRRLMVASLVEEELGSSPLGFDPSYYNFYVWGEQGVWAFRYADNPFLERQAPVRLSMYEGLEMAHQYFGGTLTYTMSLPGPNWMIMDLSSDGSHMLLADWDEPVEGNTTVRLHMAHGNGSDPSPVYAHTGGFISAQFGLMEHQIIAGTFAPSTPGDRRSEKHALVLPDVQSVGTGPLPPLAEKVRNLSTDPFSLLQSAFIKEGPFAGRVAYVEWERHVNTVRLVAPNNAFADPIEVSVPLDGPGRVQWAYEATGDGLVLHAQSGYDDYPRNPAGNTLAIVSITTNGKTAVATLPVEGEGRIAGLKVRDGYLVYATQPDGIGEPGERTQYSVYSARLSQLETGYFESTLFYSGVRPSGLSPTANAWRFGSGLFAYIRNGELHVRTYKGETDMVLETGVTALYDAGVYESLYQSLR